MTLEEAEEIARSMAALYAGDTSDDHEDVEKLARFVLAVMPTLRAAEAWATTEALDLTFDPFARDHLDSIYRLKRAIDTMRRELERGER